jgi:hypothetical protein
MLRVAQPSGVGVCPITAGLASGGASAPTVERIILDAARGSIMQLAWLVEADTGEDLALNPDHVVMLRAVGSSIAPVHSRSLHRSSAAGVALGSAG